MQINVLMTLSEVICWASVRSFVCPYVPAWAHSSKPATAGLLLRARPTGDID